MQDKINAYNEKVRAQAAEAVKNYYAETADGHWEGAKAIEKAILDASLVHVTAGNYARYDR
jgi:hypothetical protein